jgi:hypothetical protein
MVRKKVYYKKPDYQKLAIDLIRKKYLSFKNFIVIYISCLLILEYNNFNNPDILK